MPLYSDFFLLLTLTSSFSFGLQANPRESPQNLTDTICAGRPRSECEVQLDVPESCVPNDSNSDPACPIVFFLHGSGATNNFFAQTTGVHDANLIGIYPQGEGGWNTSPKDSNTCSWDNFDCDEDPDERDFIVSIISEVRSQGASGNVYAIGYSNGAALAYRLASNVGADLPIKGIVAKAMQLLASPERSGPGVLNYNQPRRPETAAVSVLSVMGTDDRLIPYNGGSSSFFGDKAFQLMSTIDSMETWATHNGCDGTLTIDGSYVTDQGNGTATKYDYSGGCPSGIILEHYAIHGGRHDVEFASIDGDKINYVIAYDFIDRVEEGSGGVSPLPWRSPSPSPVASSPPPLSPSPSSLPLPLPSPSPSPSPLPLPLPSPFPLPSPSPSPSPSSVAMPGGGSCVDDPNWAGMFNTAHTCAYVAEDPNVRCDWESSDGTKASDACLETCGNCPSPVASPVAPPSTGSCGDDRNWAGKRFNFFSWLNCLKPQIFFVLSRLFTLPTNRKGNN